MPNINHHTLVYNQSVSGIREAVLKAFCESSLFQACWNELTLRTVDQVPISSPKHFSEVLAMLHLHLPEQYSLPWVSWLLYFLTCAWFCDCLFSELCVHQGCWQCLWSSTEVLPVQGKQCCLPPTLWSFYRAHGGGLLGRDHDGLSLHFMVFLQHSLPSSLKW